jgi:hypothetical protein
MIDGARNILFDNHAGFKNLDTGQAPFDQMDLPQGGLWISSEG